MCLSKSVMCFQKTKYAFKFWGDAIIICNVKHLITRKPWLYECLIKCLCHISRSCCCFVMMGNGWKKIAESKFPYVSKVTLTHKEERKKGRKEGRKKEQWMVWARRGRTMWSERNNKNGSNVWYEVKHMKAYGRNMKH
jgi:hypothetical protein